MPILSNEQINQAKLQLQKLADDYIANMQNRSLTRDSAEVANHKERLLRALTTIPDIPPENIQEDLLDKLRLINALLTNIDARDPVPLNEFFLDGRAGEITINKSSFISRLIQFLFSWIMTPNLHFDDTLKAAKDILRETLVSTLAETKTYTDTEIATSARVKHENFASGKPDPTTVLNDLTRNTKLTGYETRGKTAQQIQSSIEGFAAGSPQVKKIITEIPSQKLLQPIENEAIDLLSKDGYMPAHREIGSMTFSRAGDKVIFACHYEVRAVLDSKGALLELMDENGDGIFKLRPVPLTKEMQPIYSARALPILRTEAEVELRVEKIKKEKEAEAPEVAATGGTPEDAAAEETVEIIRSNLRSLKIISYPEAMKLGTTPTASVSAAAADARASTPHWTHAAGEHPYPPRLDDEERAKLAELDDRHRSASMDEEDEGPTPT